MKIKLAKTKKIKLFLLSNYNVKTDFYDLIISSFRTQKAVEEGQKIDNKKMNKITYLVHAYSIT